ncbi:hypothetical protein AEQU3_00844 [Aequorivita antarctica]|nr:hypothetical protein AEQU3_00844 [Aequorivita antarctica]
MSPVLKVGHHKNVANFSAAVTIPKIETHNQLPRI